MRKEKGGGMGDEAWRKKNEGRGKEGNKGAKEVGALKEEEEGNGRRQM